MWHRLHWNELHWQWEIECRRMTTWLALDPFYLQRMFLAIFHPKKQFTIFRLIWWIYKKRSEHTGMNSPNKLLATIWVRIFNFTELRTDKLEVISASTQSGQSPSPQKRNFWNRESGNVECVDEVTQIFSLWTGFCCCSENQPKGGVTYLCVTTCWISILKQDFK